jgi:retron-type reverse transcriptase
LSIASTVDRFVQQAVCQQLDPIFDSGFSEHSYGFRKGRSAHDAVRAAQEFVREGKVWVIDLDIKAFFFSVTIYASSERSAQRTYQSIARVD